MVGVITCWVPWAGFLGRTHSTARLLCHSTLGSREMKKKVMNSWVVPWTRFGRLDHGGHNLLGAVGGIRGGALRVRVGLREDLSLPRRATAVPRSQEKPIWTSLSGGAHYLLGVLGGIRGGARRVGFREDRHRVPRACRIHLMVKCHI